MKINGLIINMVDSKNNWIGEFNDIFKWVPEQAHSLHWSILELEAQGLKLENNKRVDEFEKEIEDSPTGLILSWKELVLLGNKIDQIINGVFIGCKDLNNIHQYRNADGIQYYKDEQDLYESCDYVINMHDSTLWIVFTKDQKFYDLLVQNFEIREYVDSEEFGRNQ